jgi:uncharacterized phiE125 gp8 family phage protein
LQSVTSVTAYDDSDQASVFLAANYIVDLEREPGRLVLRNGAVWPSATRAANAIEIVFVAGYGDAADAVPEALQTAILHLVAFWYEHRGDEALSFGVPVGVMALLAPYRLLRWGSR